MGVGFGACPKAHPLLHEGKNEAEVAREPSVIFMPA